jgi:hypothetical protein
MKEKIVAVVLLFYAFALVSQGWRINNIDRNIETETKLDKHIIC